MSSERINLRLCGRKKLPKTLVNTLLNVVDVEHKKVRNCTLTFYANVSLKYNCTVFNSRLNTVQNRQKAEPSAFSLPLLNSIIHASLPLSVPSQPLYTLFHAQSLQHISLFNYQVISAQIRHIQNKHNTGVQLWI